MHKRNTIATAALIAALMPMFVLLPVDRAAANMHGAAGGAQMEGGQMGPVLMMPSMNAARGRKLFASKGCVVCHSINGVGGKDAPALDASTMRGPMNPFEFAARMWRGAEAMIYMQQEELGEQIDLTGDDLSDIIAFVHDPEEQKKFSEADIPEQVRELMKHIEESEEGEDEAEHRSNAPKE